MGRADQGVRGQGHLRRAFFQHPGLFAREWPKLLRAHALETYRRPAQAGWDERRARARLEGLLRASATAEGSLRGNAGVGQLFEFRVDGLKGSALILDGRLIHAAVL